MIKEAYVSFEVAKLLNKKGFDEECNKVIHQDTKNEYYFGNYSDDIKGRLLLVPTHQMVCRWLREIHHIHVCPDYKAFFQEKPKKIYHHWCCKIVGIDRYFKRGIQDVDVLDSDYFYFHDVKTYHDSYEEACEECIRFALENLITE